MGTAGGEGMFTVTVTKKEVVAAVLPLQEHWLPFSNLDLLLPPLDVGVFFCYKHPKSTTTSSSSSAAAEENNFGSMVGVLKKAMAQVLVTYYAFAGEVVTNSVGEPELLCSNRGVEFSEASADVELKDLNLYNPDESIEGKLVPSKKNGVLSVQATQLKCGGMVVACTFDHRIADAFSANMFLVSWAETAQSKSLISVLPSFRRSSLNPRRPVSPDPSLSNFYVPISSLPPPPKEPEAGANVVNDDDDNHLISRIYYIQAKDLTQLQSLASPNGYRRTKLEAFSAFLWQLVAKCSVYNKKNNNAASREETFTRLGIVVDGRSRLMSSDHKTAIMGSYFGNVLSIPYGTNKVCDVIENPVSWVAGKVHEFLENEATKDHFLGLIDWVEAHRPQPAVAKIYVSSSDDEPALVVSSGQRFPVSKVDFGWGSPVFGSYHFPWGGNTGYVMPMPSPAGDGGDWVVYMHLMKRHVEFIEKEAADFFRPLTADYLEV
ncbi:hypothetical protein Tsubulata_006337 [Turnera subulata]|uniref:Shikimate O-hydroxycinnamoyltransferase n=1 Tax=Turnera subulata TaxID=218843 RepID=A0A9Q0G7D2_9ROSI|nr:hypothetical protein Tsubulata_006337 [Turnera subulata]